MRQLLYFLPQGNRRFLQSTDTITGVVILVKPTNLHCNATVGKKVRGSIAVWLIDDRAEAHVLQKLLDGGLRCVH